MNNQLLQALMMGMGGAGGAGGAGMPVPLMAGVAGGGSDSPLGSGGFSPELQQFAMGALGGGGFQGGMGQLLGGMLAKKMKLRQQQQQAVNPLDQLISGTPNETGYPMQPMA